MSGSELQAAPNEEHLRLLSIFHYVVASLTALFALIPIIHIAMGISLIVSPESWENSTEGGGPPPPFFGWIIIAFAGGLMLLGWLFAAAMAYAGRSLAKHRHYTFCLVVGAVETLFMPFGTVLGVFTIIILLRPEVKNLFSTETRLDPISSSGPSETLE